MSDSCGTEKILRKEDASLLSGRGRYADDLPIPVGTLHAHVIRSPHAHAEIVRIDGRQALAHEGVWAVISGEDVRKLSDPFLAAVKTPVQQWALAVERARYVGEPVALVVAESRYIAEDAAELVEIEYAPREAVIDPQAACESTAPLLHPQAGTNEVSVREFRYGDTDAAFARADRRIAMTSRFPRLSFTPIECYVVLAQHNPAEGSYDVLANFQGPFSMHPVMARALRVAGPKLRLRIPPDSGGSFGIKLSVFPYVVLMALAARMTGRPVKWVEDRIEHLVAASSGPNRVTQIEAAVTNEGRILALAARPARRLRRVFARADAGPALSHAGRGDRRLRHRQRGREKPRRAHQQNAGEPHSRLWRSAALSGAGAADGAHRGRAEARSARRDPA